VQLFDEKRYERAGSMSVVEQHMISGMVRPS